MRNVIAYFILYFVKFSLWIRYRVTYKGVENLTPDILNRKGGVLFLPNHPTVFVDPSLVVIGIYRKFPIRPLVVEYMYYAPGVHWLMKFMNAIPIPNLNTSTNSLKRKRSERAFQEVIKGLKVGENFLIYPAGKVKRSNYELIGGSSGVHSIVQEAPEANLVLVRVTGLYGSRFSTALTGTVPSIFGNILDGMKIALKNLLFFTPRREVTIEYMPVPVDFPRTAPRLIFNRYLEHFYNRPDGIDPELATKTLPGESLHLVSYSRWRTVFPEVKVKSRDASQIDLSKIPEDIQQKVISKLAQMTESEPETIRPDLDLSSDLGLDSLDAAEIFLFLQDTFGIGGIPPSELTTVGRLMAIAAKQVTFQIQEEEHEGDLSDWNQPQPGGIRAYIAPGETIPEVFLNVCDRKGKALCCADLRTGVLSYSTFKVRVLLLADHISRLPGKNIGIMLPASVAATATVLAAQLAGKIPVMINWTVGPRHLESVIELSGIDHVLSSWAFIDRLDNVELDGVEERLVFLEDLRREMSLMDKLRAYVRSKLPTRRILKLFHTEGLKAEDIAVLLFTSGTEAMPKGVPLTHHNLLSNQRAGLEALDVYESDVLYGILPPFHSFGFTVTGLMGVLGGLRTALYPNPTDGPRLAKGVKRWGVTIVVGPPTFLKAILRAATPEQMVSMRLLVTGAEKAPPELFTLMEKFGDGNRVIEGYGITECSPILTCTRLHEPRIGVGRAVKGVELLIVHPETMEPQALGTEGMILARGPNVFSGYLHGAILPFVEIEGKQWYKTGDLGFLDEKGNLTISGRLKRFVKIGGEMISLASIESALLEVAKRKGWEILEDSPSLAVIAQEFENAKPRIILCTRFRMTVEEANAALRTMGFSNLIRISEVKALMDIPIMGSGKINYRELQARFTIHEAGMTI